MTNPATIKELAAWIAARNDFAIFGHEMPDGDAVGSCMALMMALERMGKRAMVCLPQPVPKMYMNNPRADEALVPGMMLPFIPQAAISLDASEENRLGGAKAMFGGCPEKAMMDHHETNTGFGDIWHVDGDCIATGELTLRLIEALGVELTKEIATWLFIAISTDSGNFRFAGVTADTMNAVGKLIDAGIDMPLLTRELYHTRTKARTQLLGKVIAELEVSADGQLAWGSCTKAMMDECGATAEDKEGIVNYLLEIEGVELAVLAEERGTGTKFSLRSKEWADVAKLAAAFGGGGHVRAAGCFVDLSVGQALEKLLAQARIVLEK